MGDRQKPSGADEMLEPGAWPGASEEQFYRVAQDCVNALRTLVANGSNPWNAQHRDTFRNGGGDWSGDAAGAADSKGSRLLDSFTEMQHHLSTAANWNNDIAHTVASAKDKIISNVQSALDYIGKLSQDDPEYNTLVRDAKKNTYNANLSVVSNAAAGINPPSTYKPSIGEQQLLSDGLPPMRPTPPSSSTGGGPIPGGTPKGTDSSGTKVGKQEPGPPPNAPAGNAPTSPSAPSKDTPSSGTHVEQQPEAEPNNSSGGSTTTVPATATPKATDASVTTPVVQLPPGVTAPTPAGNNAGANNASGGTVGLTGTVSPRSNSSGGASSAVSAPSSSNASSSASGLGGTGSGSGAQQSGNPTGQGTGAQQPGGPGKNPLQQGLQQFNQGLQNTAGQTSQPLASAQPATAQPTTPAPAAPTGPAGGASGTSAAPVSAASAAGGGGSVGGPAAATPAAPAAPLGPAPTPSPAAPVAQPAPGGPAGPGVAAAGTNSQQAAAAAAPIPVSPARAERDALAAAAKAGLLQRKSAGNTDADIEIARRVSAALHAPPSIPAASYQFVWAVGVTSEGQILAANSYGIGYIPDGVKLPGQVTLVSADEAIPPAERARWVNFPFLALQGWAQFHGKTLRAIIGTPEEVKPYKSSTHAEELAPDDIPADGTMQGRSRLQVIAPDAAARLEEWSDVTLYEALPPRPVQDAPPDAKQTTKLWMGAIQPLLRTTGTNGPIDHLTKLIAYADHMQSIELYKAYTAPHVAAQREAMSDWIYWQHISSICQDATNPVLGGVQA